MKRINKTWFLIIWLLLGAVLPNNNVFAGKEKVKIIKRKINVRAKPNLNSKIVGKATINELFTVRDQSKKWIKIKLETGKSGWIHESLVSFVLEQEFKIPGEVEVTARRVNVRSKPNVKGKKLGQVYKYNVFKALDQSEKWVKIRLKSGKTGWVYKTLVKPVQKIIPRKKTTLPIAGLEMAPAAQVEERHTSERERRKELEGIDKGELQFRLTQGEAWLEFGGRLHMDFRAYDRAYGQDKAAPRNTFLLRRVRLTISGEFNEMTDFYFNADLIKDRSSIQDAFINFRLARNIAFRVGQFVIPFSLDRATSTTLIDFIERSLPADRFAPGLDIGAMLKMRFFRKRTTIYLAAYNGNGADKKNKKDGLGYAMRALYQPFRRLKTSPFRNFRFGGSTTWNDNAEGAKSFKGESAGDIDFFEPIKVSGLERLAGLEASWRCGPFSLKSDYIWGRQNREGLAADSTDLPPFEVNGWYVSATWLLTGEERKLKVQPWRPMFSNTGGFGAIELAVRLEEINFQYAEDEFNTFRSSAQAWTFGLNWYLTSSTRFQFNIVVDRFRIDEDLEIPAHRNIISALSRLQYDF